MSPSTLTFTPQNWNAARTVTVTGVDDPIADDDQAFTAQLGAATSSDAKYNGLSPSDVALTNLDTMSGNFTLNVDSIDADLKRIEALQRAEPIKKARLQWRKAGIAIGQGGVVKHVAGLVNPAGVRIAGFGPPTEQERAQDFLWRIEKALPPPGAIGVFDRSHYEDVLIARVNELVPTTAAGWPDEDRLLERLRDPRVRVLAMRSAVASSPSANDDSSARTPLSQPISSAIASRSANR